MGFCCGNCVFDFFLLLLLGFVSGVFLVSLWYLFYSVRVLFECVCLVLGLFFYLLAGLLLLVWCPCFFLCA